MYDDTIYNSVKRKGEWGGVEPSAGLGVIHTNLGQVASIPVHVLFPVENIQVIKPFVDISINYMLVTRKCFPTLELNIRQTI